MIELKDKKVSNERDLKGLDGWLILVGIGLVVSPIRLLIQLIPMYSEFAQGGAWDVLTTPESPLYHPLWAPLIFGEMIINFGIFIVALVLIFLFFSKKRIFPKVYIGLAIFTIIFLLTDALLGKIVMPNEPLFDAETGIDFFKSIVSALIWVPYMLVSKRVKQTFVE